MSDLVSVIIPTYNRSQFVTESIDSVLAQTYPDLEIIVVNDGSTDGTEDKLQPYMDKIIYIKKENGGVSSAVNAGLRVAKGKYVTRLDDDDLFMPTKVEKQVRVFEENPSVGLVTSGCFITDAIGRNFMVRDAPNFPEYGAFVSLLLHYTLLQPTVMLRRECHDKVGFYKGTIGEDYEMFLKVSRYWDVAAVNQPLAKHRRHSGNVTIGISENEEFRKKIRNFIRDILDEVSLAELFPDICFISDPYRESCAYTAKAALYLRHKIFDRAEAGLRRALELCPDNAIPIVWSGILARSQGDFQSAEDRFSKIEEEDELYSVVQDAKALITAIQNDEKEKSKMLVGALLRERLGLFEITYRGIRGKDTKKASSHQARSNGLRISRNAVVISDYPKQGNHIVFNTFTDAMISVGDELKELFTNPERPIGEYTSRDLLMLKKMGILVNQEFDEAEMARKWYEASRSVMSRVQATILTTYDCNFACTYCIEEGVRKPVYMDDPCSDSTANWLMDMLRENDTKELTVLFYGGEPLLNAKPITRISEKLQKFAVDKGIVMSSAITTNGSLLDGQLLQELTALELRSIKITIDGVREIHNSRRPFKSGKGSFDVIMRNIREVPETVALVIEANLDSENVVEFPQLLDFLETAGLKDRIDDLVISSVYPSVDSAAIRGADCRDLFGSQIADELAYMKRLAAERGFKSKFGKVKHIICSMNRYGSSVVIDPLGYIYNCLALVGREGFRIGSVCHQQGSSISGELPIDRLKGCFQCTYFTICGGGCPYKAYILYGDHTKVLCEKEIIESKTREAIKLKYDQRKQSVTA